LQSLAVKYRPKTFEECCGQTSIIKILKRQLEINALKHAYLFCGSSGCVDKDTEFFNGTTWKKISDYEPGDNVLQYNADGTATLVMPDRYVKVPCNTLHRVKTKYGVDMCLCDEHTVVYQTSRGNLSTKNFKDFRDWLNTSNHAIPAKLYTTFSYSGRGINLTDSEIKLMCAVICDGTFRKDIQSNWCTINIKKRRKINRLREILLESGIDFTESMQSNGYVRFYFKSPRKEKEFSSFWYNCNQHQLQIICDNILYWDGSISNNRMSFSQNNKSTIDFIQFAFSSCGFRSSISSDDRVGKLHSKSEYKYKSITYRLSITKRNMVGFGNQKNRVTEYKTLDGYKYCFTVPSHMWIMRRNGNIIVTGNCGKTTCARIFANEINKGEGHPIEIDAASNSGVDNVREIIKQASERSIDSFYKIFIIDECHALSSAAWQAFLKCIEETPEYTIFIFCTTDPQKIPQTIINRCMRFNFTRLNSSQIKDRLNYISQTEGFTNYQDSTDYISRICKGQMRDAIAYLEQASDYDTNMSMENTINAIGNFSYKIQFDLINNIIDGDEGQVLYIIDELYNNGSDLKLFIDSFLTFNLDLMKYSLLKNINILQIPQTLENEVIKATGIQNADKYFSYVIDKLLELKNMLKTDSTIKNTVEVMLLQITRCK